MRVHRLYLAAGLALLAAKTEAFTLTPMSATFTPEGNGTARNFRVVNESSNRMAYQIRMYTRDMNEEGDETMEPAEEKFTVFPPQGIVEAGQSQTVRIVWKGSADPTNELAFRLEAEELPVDFTPEPDKAEIRVLVRYLAALYVRPRDAKPNLKFSPLTRTATNTYVLSVTNRGGAHQSLIEPTVALTDSRGQQRTLTASQLESIAGQNVLAHHTRHFVLTLPAEFAEATYQAEIHVEE